MLEFQRLAIAPHSTYDTDNTPQTRLRAASVDSHHSNLSSESYTTSTSAASSTRVQPRSDSIYSDLTETDESASSTYVHPRTGSTYSEHTETEESVDSTHVQRPESPNDYAHDTDQYMMEVYVLCLYDFDSDDPDHTPFKKNDILKIIAQEPSGWWAAQLGYRVGWIPSAFVAIIPPDMVQRLRDAPFDLREYEFMAEALYSDAPIANLNSDNEDIPPREQIYFDDDQVVPVPHPLSPNGFPIDVTPGLFRHFEIPSDIPSDRSPASGFLTDTWNSSGKNPNVPRTPRTPIPPKGPAPAPSATTPPVLQHQGNLRQPVPQLKLNTTPLRVDKPTPPTPVATTPVYPSPATNTSVSPPFSSNTATTSSNYSSPILPRSRSLGSSSVSIGSSTSSSSRQRPNAGIYSPGSVRNLTDRIYSAELLTQSSSGVDQTSLYGNSFSRRYVNGGVNKVFRLTGDDDAQAFHNARAAQAQQPWYLNPDYMDDIQLDYDGSVKAGTLNALVERLTMEPLRVEQEGAYRHTFLTSFHTFTTADTLLDLLIQKYQMDPPPNLADVQFRDWIEKKFQPTQARVLHFFKIWVEEYGMIDDDPHIIPRIRDFLSLIENPGHVKVTKSILKVIDIRQRFDINMPPLASSAPTRRPMKRQKNDLLKVDHGDLARQLTLYEARLYLKIRPHECLTWGSSQRGDSVRNLGAFVSTNDKLASWVKMSVLNNDALGKRADTIELWIKVAEKCRALNNFSSMSAIIAALKSPVFAKLQLTWAHVNRASHVDALANLFDTTGNFTAYRNILLSIEGPCLPYIGISLSDMVKISENSSNFKPHSTDAPSDPKLINFVKRQKMGDVAHTIMRHQPKVRDQYKIPENPSVMEFVENQLKIAAGKDDGVLWARSQEVQHAELAHADIRKGLEAAGF